MGRPRLVVVGQDGPLGPDIITYKLQITNYTYPPPSPCVVSTQKSISKM